MWHIIHILVIFYITVHQSLGQNVLHSCYCGQRSINTRVIGGQEAVPHAYPWMVALLRNDKTVFCGGAIINSRWILTAAHCVSNMLVYNINVAIGAHYTNLTYDDFSVASKVIVHEKFSGVLPENGMYNDIALIRLDKPIRFTSRVQPICLPPSWMTTFSGPLTLAGFGRLEKRGAYAEALQVADFRFMPTSMCYERVFTKALIHEDTMCVQANFKNGVSGDSGSPLSYLYQGFNYVVGIASWTTMIPSYPMGVARVGLHLKWIENMVSDGDYCQNPSAKQFG